MRGISYGGNGVSWGGAVLAGVDRDDWGRSRSRAGLYGNSGAGLSGDGSRLDGHGGGVLLKHQFGSKVNVVQWRILTSQSSSMMVVDLVTV